MLFTQISKKLRLSTNQFVNLRKFSESQAPFVMGDQKGLLLSEVIKKLEDFAPLKLAETWDNVGLLIDQAKETPIKTIMLTNDLTEGVLSNAIDQQTDLIITYHPNIFQGLKRITQGAWKERIIIKCIANNIAVFSPHTSWDSVNGGVNDWLVSGFDTISVKPLIPRDDNPNQGPGRLLTLTKPIPVTEVISNVKRLTGLKHIRVALGKNKTSDSLVKSIALCAGSGSSVLKGHSADLYLTGEMLHHDILDATQNDIHVILTNHSDSERGFLKYFRNQLRDDILQNRIDVKTSFCDCDPLTTV